MKMKQLSIHLGHMMQGLPIGQRMQFARRLSCDLIEFPFPYEVTAAEYAELLRRNALRQDLIIAPASNYNAGERGYAVDPQLTQVFRNSIEKSIEYATCIGCRFIHVMSGCVDAQIDRSQAISTMLENFVWAQRAIASAGFKMLIEPINSVDFPGYLVDRPSFALDICRSVGEGLGLLFDVYHCCVMGEDPAAFVQSSAKLVGHIQIADWPGRGEPGCAQFDFDGFFQTLANVGYSGTLGLEYKPTLSLEDSLRAVDAHIGGSLRHWLAHEVPHIPLVN